MLEPLDLDTLRARVAEARADGLDRPETVDAMIALGERLFVDDPGGTEALSGEIQEIARRIDYPRGIAYGVGLEAYARFMRSDHERAESLYREALRLLEPLDEPEVRAYIYNGLASVYLSVGDYEQALEHGLQSLELLRRIGHLEGQAWCLNGLGIGYQELGQPEKALTHYEQSLAIFRETGPAQGEGRALTSIGGLHLERGDLDAALRCHEEALALFRSSGNVLGEARALNDLGVVAHRRGDLDAAIEYHEESLRLRREIGNRQSQSTSLIHLGRIYAEQERLGDALGLLHDALSIAEDIQVKPRIFQAHEALAEVYERAGDLSAAVRHLKAYQEVHETVLGEQAMARVHRLQARAEREQAEKEAELERLRNVDLKEKNDELHRLVNELRAAQDQLVETEKMASLGRLTAGIAHEIKNPLNFVNNFAELSLELLAEIEDLLETRRGDSVETLTEEMEALLADLRVGASKIQEHGRRADRIVRSMMLHARGDAVARQHVDLNELIDEYVHLAYHGMRAQQPDFNVTLRSRYGEGVGTVELVPQEIGRVLLNLLGNAFYAVHERARSEDGYEPEVVVASQGDGARVTVRIRDNGTGIPADARAHLFEPFFTTKPAGEGTGLGLSLSYEIVTRGHGGTLRFESEEGAFTEFVLTLPRRDGD